MEDNPCFGCSHYDESSIGTGIFIICIECKRYYEEERQNEEEIYKKLDNFCSEN